MELSNTCLCKDGLSQRSVAGITRRLTLVQLEMGTLYHSTEEKAEKLVLKENVARDGFKV